MERPTLSEIFDMWQDGECFFDLMVDPPWGDAVDAKVLDMIYFGEHSGSKLASPIVKKILSPDSKNTKQNRAKLASMVMTRNSVNWTKLWATVTAQYNPIHNYNMTEEILRTSNKHGEEDVGRSTEEADVSTTSLGTKTSVEHGRTTDDVTYTYGYNSPNNEDNPSDKNVSTEGGTTDTVNSGTNSSTENRIGSDKENKVKNDHSVDTETMRRYGNIGVTTSQKMVADERALWAWNFFDEVFSSVDKTLALAVHDVCRV